MFCNLMRSTSVFAITVALAAPAPVLSQEAETCADGEAPVMIEGSEAPVCPEDIVDADAEAEVEVETEAEAEGEAQTGTTEETAAEAEVVEESEVEAEAAVETDAEAETTAETETAAESAEEVEAQTEVEQATTAESEAAAEETTEEAATEAETGEETTSDAGTDSGDAEETTAESSTEAGASSDETTAETATEAETAEETTAEIGAESEEETTVEAATEETTEETTAATEGEAETAEDSAAAETETATQVEVVQDDTEESAASANETIETEAAQADDSDTAPAETDTVETVTEETTRSSDEEFESRTQVSEGRDSGMSDLEKFALGALGGAAIATFLNRNNEEVVVSSRDRLVVQNDDGYYRVLKNDDALLRRPGVDVATREFSDGSTRTVVTRQDGSQVVTIRSADGQVLRRTRILADGRQVVLFDDTRDIDPVDVATLRAVERTQRVDATDGDSLRAALAALENPAERRFSLQQIRQIRAVRELVPEIDLENVNFETGSAVVRPEEAGDLRAIGLAIAEAVNANPNEVFLIEGHTDATGGAAMNLALSDRRAESVALALTEYFDIPPENLVVQGYGEANLKVRTQEAERLNRRVAVRKITPLLYARAGN